MVPGGLGKYFFSKSSVHPGLDKFSPRERRV